MKIDFEIEPSSILKDVKIITPSIFEEPRGSIWTSYLDSPIGSLLPAGIGFKHDKFSKSKANVLRGIHGDHKSWKLVSCIHGSVKQVVVDMRENSDTYLTWQSFDLTENNKKMILVPLEWGMLFMLLEILRCIITSLRILANTWTQVISLQLCGTTRDLTLLGQLTIQFFQSETGDYSLQKIEHAGEIISIIYRDEDWVKGLNFITPSDMFVQVGSWWYEKGKVLARHVHKKFDRTANRTQECVYVRKGSMRSLYTQNNLKS